MADTSRPEDPSVSGRPVVPETRARQGQVSHRVIWVLLASTLLAAVALAIAWAVKAPDLARGDAQQGAARTASAPGFTAPEPAAIVPPPGTDHTSPGAPTPQNP